MSFQNLGLSEALLKAVTRQGYDTPTTIQQKAIPVILEGRDLLASAQTGTGKTAGFTLPMLQVLAGRHVQGPRKIRALVLTPTRELAAQVQESVRTYGQFLNLYSTVIFGGVKQHSQVKSLRKGIDILVATPGRLLDLEQQGHLSLSDVEILVLDEADRMLDMGFVHDIRKVLRLLPDHRQNLLFSATFSAEIKQLAKGFMRDPQMVAATPEQLTADRVEQKIYNVSKNDKTAFLTGLILEGDWSQVLVFTRTKHGANRLSKKLVQAGIESAPIHSNKSQSARTKALAAFKANRIRVLVATDIAARGLDIPQLPHVINFELPNVPEDYVHRIGRTGRAGMEGEAISLVSPDETKHIRGIEKLIGSKLDRETADVDALPEPVKPESGKAPAREGNRASRRNNTGNNRRNKRKKPWYNSRRKKGNTSGNQSRRGE